MYRYCSPWLPSISATLQTEPVPWPTWTPSPDTTMIVQAHIVEILATRQVKSGDKLPLKEIVKETDPTKSFSLTPTGKNVFARVPSLYHSLISTYAHFFFLENLKQKWVVYALRIPFSRFLFSPVHENVLTNKYLHLTGWHAWSVHTCLQLASVRIHLDVRRRASTRSTSSP